MSIPNQLETAREMRNVSGTHIAAFIGVTKEGYRDLESCDDEVYVIQVIKFMRVCVALNLSPEALMLGEDTPGRKVEFARNEYGAVTIAADLAALCGDIGATADAIEWEQDALAQWLKDDCGFGQMPMPALKDLCNHLGIQFLHVLKTYWEALGQAGSNAAKEE